MATSSGLSPCFRLSSSLPGVHGCSSVLLCLAAPPPLRAEACVGLGDDVASAAAARSGAGLVGVALGASALGLAAFDVVATGLPPEEKPKLCDAAYETELQNVAANYVAMVPNGQIFDSSLEKGQPYIFRVGSGQVVLDVYPCRRGLTTNQRLSSARFDCWRSVVKFSFLCTSEHNQRSAVARAEPDVGRGHH